MQNKNDVESSRIEVEDITRRKEKIMAELDQNQTQVANLKAKVEFALASFEELKEHADKFKGELDGNKQRENQLR